MAASPKRQPKSASPAAEAGSTRSESGSATPSMAQYIEIKTANPDCLLFYRMGDFYELFFDDAVQASQALGIALTKRGKHDGEDVPMAGVPVKRGDEYLQKLIRHGFRVAVCEQMESPKDARERGSKAVVRREVVRLVTPGTLTEDTLLDATRNNYFAAVFQAPGTPEDDNVQFALAAADISTGDLVIGALSGRELAGELVRLDPGEVLVSDAAPPPASVAQAIQLTRAATTPFGANFFDSRAGVRDLKECLGIADISSLGEFSRAELAVLGAVLAYVDITQIGRKGRLKRPVRIGASASLVIDAATRRNLEIERTTSGEKKGSLLSAIDRTVTAAGSRELSARLSAPLLDLAAISERLDAVSFMRDEAPVRDIIRDALRGAPDITRALARLAFGRGSPRDLGAVRDGLLRAGEVGGHLAAAAKPVGLPAALETLAQRLENPLSDLVNQLSQALAEELPLQRKEGGFIAPGYREELDENRRLRDDSRQVLAEMQARYQTETGVASLKVRHNNMIGYFIDVTRTHGEKFLESPLSERFRHRQTLVSAYRFTTDELEQTEGKITAAAERALALEHEIFADLANAVGAAADELAGIADALANLDVYCGLGTLAQEENYNRPILDDSRIFDLRGARHPVVEQALAAANEPAFIANDCYLGAEREKKAPAPRSGTGKNGEADRKAEKARDAKADKAKRPQPQYSQADAKPPAADTPGFDELGMTRILLMTGPNMSGKSTYLRQNALIVLLAQMGSFVPADYAYLGLVDRLFSRVGASDDLARGRSTFMVEMVETATILNQASERSLVILDEIGRGTATYDGLSIAWATIEHLHEVNCCRALFATHYHELTALAGQLQGVANATIDVKEWRDEIIFLHRVIPGAADRSYGIQVAKLAGLPDVVVARAGEILKRLEEHEAATDPEKLFADLPLFASARPKSFVAGTDEAHPALAALRDVRPDEMTPRDALDALYRLKALSQDET